MSGAATNVTAHQRQRRLGLALDALARLVRARGEALAALVTVVARLVPPPRPRRSPRRPGAVVRPARGPRP